MDNSANVLIVDDTELNRDVLEGLVSSLGHHPTVVASGKEALSLLQKGTLPDLILLDILMPEISGFDVLNHVKKDESLRQLPVIMISIVDEMESIVRCIELGADDFMTKPFNVILLKARINACLARKKYEDSQKQFSYWLADSYQKLQKAELVRDEMFNMIVHDMNNSLVTLLGETELLVETAGSEFTDETFQSLTNIGNAGKHVQTLVGGILDISAMEKGQMSPVKKEILVDELVRSTAKQYEKAITDRNGTLKTSFFPARIACSLDGPLFQRILQNLLTNVVKHGLTHDHPLVNIVVTANENTVDITVNDNGSGIPEEKLNKIFKKYYKINPQNKGLGLGLAFCKMATEAMGGTISGGQSPSDGASFSLTFPKT